VRRQRAVTLDTTHHAAPKLNGTLSRCNRLTISCHEPLKIRSSTEREA
jgi:hypothetical protein